MRSQNFVFALVVLLFSSCHYTSNLNSAPTTMRNSNSNDSLLFKEREKLKNYALCKCLLIFYSKDSTLINDGSLEGYIETSSYGNIAYEKVDSFLQKNATIHYDSKFKKKLFIMRCADIYNSKGLDSLINALDDYNSLKH